jgi:membrane associated rhomboid family serine protease
MMVLPYRAKNPPEKFPILTLCLIGANILIYVATCDGFWSIRDSALADFAFSNENFSIFRLLSAMFLHANALHLAGNMLFLWIFGAAVEGRLGIARFLGLYIVAGLAGDILQTATIGLVYPARYNLGASGAIMGLAGAYLYMFPFANICVLWSFGWRIRISDWHAQWVILYFLGFDLLDALLYQGWDGVGHFAHIGGAVCGFFLPMLLNISRDSEEASGAQAMRVDAHGDYSVLSIHELESLLENRPGDMALLMTFCRKAADRAELQGPKRCMEVIRRHALVLQGQADPELLSHLILNLGDDAGAPPAGLLMGLGARLESTANYPRAMDCYRKVAYATTSPEVETAFARLARLTDQTDTNKHHAAQLYLELLDRFPHGSQAFFAENALRRMGVARPAVALSHGRVSPEAVSAAAELPPDLTVEEPTIDHGLSPVSAVGPARTEPRTALPEPAYHVGETRGMVLRPIGNAALDESA